MAPMNLFQGNDYRDFFVWWDKENCPVPKKYDSFRVREAVVAGLKQRGFHGRVNFEAAVSLERNTGYDDMRRLHETGIPFVSAEPEFEGPQASDNKIKSLVDKWIVEWTRRGKPPAGILIITSDSDFADIFARCKNVGLLTGLFYAQDRAKAYVSMIAHFDHHWLNVLKLAPEADREELARHNLVPVAERFQKNTKQKRLDYDAFLLENPLHYEKWIDYANDENSLGSLGNAYYVYERALAILTHSVDLWVHYCKESINSDWPCDDIRNLFNRATLIVGSNYTASPLWNTIIGFETKQEDLKQLAMVYTTLFMHPIQHLDAYLISFKELVYSNPRLIAEESAAVGSANLDAQKYIKIREDAHSKAKQFQSLIVGFETSLTMAYYHTNLPIDEDELKTWDEYLNFIDDKDINKVINLYERCLIACAYLPEYWVRYVLCMHKRHWNHSVDELIDRATKLVFPKMKDALKVLKPLLNGGNDDRVLSQVCLVLFRRLDGGPADMIDAVVSEDVFPLLVQLLGHSSSSVLPNVYRVVGNIVKCAESSSQFITDSDVLTRLYQLLARDDTEGIQKGVCWIISRLTDGKGAQIEDVVGTEIYDKAINVLKMFWDEDEKNQNMVGMLFGSN